mgnify:CR=1 FL=1
MNRLPSFPRRAPLSRVLASILAASLAPAALAGPVPDNAPDPDTALASAEKEAVQLDVVQVVKWVPES